MAIRAAPEEEKVEYRNFDAVFRCERSHECLLILVCHFLHVIQVFEIDWVDSRLAHIDWNLVEQFVLQQLVIAVIMIKGYSPFICKENFPLVEVDSVFRITIARFQ